MNYRFLTTILTTSAISLAIVPLISQTVVAQEVRFICAEGFDRSSGQRSPTTFAWTTRGKIAVIRWKTEQFPGYPPQRRCNEVSPRFQEAYSNGSLNFITNGIDKGQSVICTATEQGGTCQTMLMTLRQEDDSLQILNELKNILNGRARGPIPQSSGSQAYFEIDIQEFLENAPVEEDLKEQ